VMLGIIVLRRTNPDRARPFRMPLVPWLPVLGIAICLILMFNLPAKTWILFGVWMAIGLVIYFLYGYGHSRLRNPESTPTA